MGNLGYCRLYYLEIFQNTHCSTSVILYFLSILPFWVISFAFFFFSLGRFWIGMGRSGNWVDGEGVLGGLRVLVLAIGLSGIQSRYISTGSFNVGLW